MAARGLRALTGALEFASQTRCLSEAWGIREGLRRSSRLEKTEGILPASAKFTAGANGQTARVCGAWQPSTTGGNRTGAAKSR